MDEGEKSRVWATAPKREKGKRDDSKLSETTIRDTIL